MTTTAPTAREIAEPGTEAPATIAEITDARLRAVVTAFVTVVEELENNEVEHEEAPRTIEQAWKELDDERPLVIAAAQASIDALDQLAASSAATAGGGDR